MYFIDIVQDDCSVQIMATNKLMGMDPTAFNDCHSFFKIGDYIAVRVTLPERKLRIDFEIEQAN